MGFWDFFNFDLNKGWKKGKFYKQRKFDNDFMSVRVPWYEISQFNGQCAIIINGRQLIIKKLPKNKEYFIDKNLGMFEINPDKSFFLNKCAVYFYDVRNQNALDPGLTNELYKWANNQGLYKIRRADIKHAIRLRTLKTTYETKHKKNKKIASELAEEIDQINQTLTIPNLDESQQYDLTAKKTELEKQLQDIENQTKSINKELTDQLLEEKKQTRKFITSVREEVKKKNAQTESQRQLDQGDPNSDEYHLIDEDETNYLISKNLFDNGYIDEKQRKTLDFKLRRKEIKSTDDLLSEIDSFTDKFVTEPISHELERLLDDYYTYNPRNVIMYISALHKIRNGINKLRTKAVINWFPSMYILFGLLGVGVIYMLWAQYGGQVDPSALIPGT